MTARTVQSALTDPPLVKVRTLTAGEFLATVLAASRPDRTWVRDTDPHDDRRLGEYLRLEQSIDTLTGTFDAWRPYE